MEHEEVAIVGGGCFWCVEAVFRRLKGVTEAVSGYAGGTVPHPSYEQVCSGKTGHAEVVLVTFDPLLLAYEELLRIFFSAHDPTSLNRQGSDVGSQYRSIIIAQDEEQFKKAQSVKEKLASEYAQPLTTEIVLGAEFYPAEEYHQRYFEKNPDHAYCQLVVAPKVKKFQDRHPSRYRPMK